MALLYNSFLTSSRRLWSLRSGIGHSSKREEFKQYDVAVKCIWLKPKVVAQIEFTEWTPDGHLRHSKFVGLRDDKDPRWIVKEERG
jgi:ATP-dependent DNA ligase